MNERGSNACPHMSGPVDFNKKQSQLKKLFPGHIPQKCMLVPPKVSHVKSDYFKKKGEGTQKNEKSSAESVWCVQYV